VDALALPAEQAEDLDGLVACGSESVRQAGAGLSDLAGSHGCVLTLRLCLSARLVCYLWVASGSPMAWRMVTDHDHDGHVVGAHEEPVNPDTKDKPAPAR
jgi:hypothetical protein